MKTLTQEEFEQVVQTISKEMPTDYDMNKAVMYGVDLDDNNQISFNKITEDGDVYEMLNPFNTIWKMKGYDFFTVVTCGWAAPISEEKNEYSDSPPSQHPAKRRVMLTVNATTDNKIGSTISFKDDQKNAIFDYGNAIGSLADAFVELINSFNKEQQ